ncbi:MAG: hypothetical protein D3908_14305, partial [Candidatus Electrothrix sp. AUS4]|nr:hypothetical protein [Candidatus Electrothrix sp. AUS4]
TEIVTEPHDVGGEFGLLDLDDDSLAAPVGQAHRRCEIKPVNSERPVALVHIIAVFRGLKIKVFYFLADNKRDDLFRYAVVGHQIFEDNIIHRIRYLHCFCPGIFI